MSYSSHIHPKPALEFNNGSDEKCISDHISTKHSTGLGNLLVTVIDKKVAIANGAGTHIAYFESEITTISDYYPFGMFPKTTNLRFGSFRNPERNASGLIQERSYTATAKGYRFGFNGQEGDDEVAGEGNSYTAEFWQYDSRLGRRFNVDPKAYKVPGLSTYSVLFNNPLSFTDNEGDFPDPLAPFIFQWLRSKEGLLVTFRETQIYAGVGGGYIYALNQEGEIYDQVGFTVFSAKALLNTGFSDDGYETWIIGGGIEYFDIGFFRKTGTNEGTDFLDEETPFALNIGPVDVQFTKDGIGVSGGISEDFGISKLYEKVNGMLALDELLSTRRLKVNNQSDIINGNGDVIGQTGELMVKTRSHWYNRNAYWEKTGITVSNYSTDDRKAAWKSENYNNEQYDAEN